MSSLRLRPLLVSWLLQVVGACLPLPAAGAPALASAAAAPAAPAPWPLWFHGIQAIQTHEHLAAWLGSAQGLLDTPVRLVLVDGRGEPPRLELQRGGLGLGDALRYSEANLGSYRLGLQRLALQAGEADPLDAANRLLSLERRLAARWVQQDSGKPLASRTELPAGFNWQAFLAAARVPADAPLHLAQPASLAGLSRLLADVPLADWKLYLRLHSVAQLSQAAERQGHTDGQRLTQQVHAALGRWDERMQALRQPGPTVVSHPAKPKLPALRRGI